MNVHESATWSNDKIWIFMNQLITLGTGDLGPPFRAAQGGGSGWRRSSDHVWGGPELGVPRRFRPKCWLIMADFEMFHVVSRKFPIEKHGGKPMETSCFWWVSIENIRITDSSTRPWHWWNHVTGACPHLLWWLCSQLWGFKNAINWWVDMALLMGR